MSDEQTRDKLSQDEIDALLGGVESGEIITDDNSGEVEIRVFDFAAQERIVSGRMAGLNVVNERFVRNFRTSMMNLLRQHVDVAVIDVNTMRASEYFSTLPIPSCINLIRLRPLQGTSVCVFDNELVFNLVDSLFGGGSFGNPKSKSRTEFTQMEIRIVNMVLDLLFENMNMAWQTVYQIKIEGIGLEINPQLVSIAGPNDVIVVKRFKIELDSSSTGEIHVAIPYSCLEPIRGKLEEGSQGDQEEINDIWARALREEIFDAKIELRGDIAQVNMSLDELAKLKAGDVVPIDMFNHITLLAGGVPSFRAKFGASHGNFAVKILGRVDRE